MAIGRSGQRRPETVVAELDAYVREFRAGGYPVARVVHAGCARCGGSEFGVRVDDEAGYADRTCHLCGDRCVMLDAADVAEDADPGDAACLCGGERFDVAVGFALRKDDEVRWASGGVALHHERRPRGLRRLENRLLAQRSPHGPGLTGVVE